jgi:hypothetical protein
VEGNDDCMRGDPVVSDSPPAAAVSVGLRRMLSVFGLCELEEDAQRLPQQGGTHDVTIPSFQLSRQKDDRRYRR